MYRYLIWGLAVIAAGSASAVPAPGPEPVSRPFPGPGAAVSHEEAQLKPFGLRLADLMFAARELQGKPAVTGRPYRATLHIEAPGASPADTVLRTARRYARDGRGRVWQEAGPVREGQSSRMIISDPATGRITFLLPEQQVALTLERQTRAFPAPAGAAKSRQDHLIVPGTTMRAPSQPPAAAGQQLGTRSVHGLLVEGSRLPGSDPSSWRERWRSPALQADVEVRQVVNGVTASRFWVSELAQGEPPAALFEIPAAYRRVTLLPRPLAR